MCAHAREVPSTWKLEPAFLHHWYTHSLTINRYPAAEVGLGPRCHIYIFNLQHTTPLLISQDHAMNSKSILWWKMFFANKLNITPEDLSPKPWRRKIILLTLIFLIQCPAEQLPFSWAGRLQCRKHDWLAHVSPEPSILSAHNNNDLKRWELGFPEYPLHPGPVLNARYVSEHLIPISQLVRDISISQMRKLKPS